MIAAMICIMSLTFVIKADADPRMEINDNFCHFIKDPNNTDNEIFIGGCDAKISVTDEVASGYVRIVEWMSKREAKVLLDGKKRYIFTNNDSDSPCTMVESNGTEYNSNNWKSSITHNRHKIVYELICLDGE